MNSKRNGYKTLGDIFTVTALTIAFALAFYFGFFRDETGTVRLSGGYFALLTFGGALILFGVGSLGAFHTRKKKNVITPGFLALFCAQIVAIAGLGAVGYSVWMDLFTDTLGSPALRCIYIVGMLIVLLGYAETVFVSEPRFGTTGEVTLPADSSDEEDVNRSEPAVEKAPEE